MTRQHLALLLSVGLAAGAVTSAEQQQPPAPPVFQSRVEVTSVDVGVVDGKGQPITDLKGSDFTVRIDGQPRRVVSAEWISLTTPAGAGDKTPTPPLPEGYTSNASATGGRLIVLAIDLPNIRFGGVAAVRQAANRFIDKLLPSDRIAVVGFGVGAPATPFLADFSRAKEAVNRMNGTQVGLPTMNYAISLTEAQAILHHEENVLERVIDRECPPKPVGPRQPNHDRDQCISEVEVEGSQLADFSDQQANLTLEGLRNLFLGLRNIDLPKTVVLLSEGFVTSDATVLGDEIGRLAAAARSSLYVLQLDNQLFDIATGPRDNNRLDDKQLRARGLEAIANASRGDIFPVAAAAGPVFDRVQSELSGYYLLGVESSPTDRDGNAHPIQIQVPRRGAIVRARRQVINTAAETGRSPQQAVAVALSSPLPLSALPLRVATFALQGPEQNRVQMLIHADVGTEYSNTRTVAVGYAIVDANGKTIESRIATGRLAPLVNGVPSALQFTGGAALAPGEYTLKFVAAEGDRVGSVEHPIHAALRQSSGVALSELMVGGPVEVRELIQPTVGYTVNFGAVHGYVEAYGPEADAVTVKYEIAADEDAPALLMVDVPGLMGRDERMIFSRVVPVPQLPPGTYVLRARMASAGRALPTLTRRFEVAPPPVLMTAASGNGAAAASTTPDLFLPIDERSLSRAFNPGDVLASNVLGKFRSRVPPSTRAAFDAGVTALGAKDYSKAEASFKAAVQPDADSAAALVYLAASFAAAGHDTQAAAAWQTSMTDPASDQPEVYDWLCQALLRTHSLAEAQVLLEEAYGKWPADPRFTGPLALVYATFGKGVQAARLLERYLEEGTDNVDFYRLGVEWIYQVHAAGALVRTRADDIKLAHAWAERYGSGPQQALVKQWVDFLDKP